ncbi:12035_t:CDS:1, partial [Ambispora leptoticha]
VQRQKLTEKEAQKKYRRAKGFGQSLWALSLEGLDNFLEKNKNNLDSLQIEGFQNLLSGLDEFLEEESIVSLHENHHMEIFSSATLESTDIIRATSSFHGKPVFSNVIISGCDGESEITWYGL